MTLTEKYQSVCVLLAVITLGMGYGFAGTWKGIILLALLGVFWWAGVKRGWSGVSTISFGVILAIAAFAIWLDISIFMILPGIVFGLSAWDLSLFGQTLKKQAQNESTAGLERNHIHRLLIADGASLALSVLALVLQFRLNLFLIFLFSLLLVLSISWATGLARREVN